MIDDAAIESAASRSVEPQLSQRAYEALRAMAITYRLPPGSRLNEGELARALNVSRTPLREAMNRLVSEDLLVSVKGRGFFARALDVQEVLALYEARLGIETFIVQLACARAEPHDLDELDAYLDRSSAAHEGAAVDDLVRLDEGFHERVAKLTGNPELLRILQNINARIHFFRWVDMRGRRDQTQAEHRSLVAAIRSGIEADALAIARRHITRRLDQIVEGIREGYARLYMGEGPGIDEAPKPAEISNRETDQDRS
jgi:DNA-binding GntR family transcriptional regulator